MSNSILTYTRPLTPELVAGGTGAVIATNSIGAVVTAVTNTTGTLVNV